MNKRIIYLFMNLLQQNVGKFSIEEQKLIFISKKIRVTLAFQPFVLILTVFHIFMLVIVI